MNVDRKIFGTRSYGGYTLTTSVDGFAALFNCEPVDRASDSQPKNIHFSYLVPELFVCCFVLWASTDDLLLFQISSGVV